MNQNRVETPPMDASAINALAAQWAELRTSDKKIRQRNAAAKLGVSEGELLSTRVGQGVTRLKGRWQDLLHDVQGLGKIMALTRNEYAVIEKEGNYDKLDLGEAIGVTLDRNIDLRLFFNHWVHGFAVEDTNAAGRELTSLQFYDSDGTAVHKIYALEETNMEAWAALVEKWTHDDQTPGITTSTPHQQPAPLPIEQVDTEAVRENWRNLKDTHDFFGMLRKHRVERRQALRLAPDDFTVRLSVKAVEAMLKDAASTGLSIMAFVGSPGCIGIHTGPINKIKTVGEWLNVLDPGFNLHIIESTIDEVWIVRKPTKDGIVTALEVYAEDGQQIVQFFGERKEGNPELEGWRELLLRLPTYEG